MAMACSLDLDIKGSLHGYSGFFSASSSLCVHESESTAFIFFNFIEENK